MTTLTNNTSSYPSFFDVLDLASMAETDPVRATVPNSTRSAAEAYLARGLAPIPLPTRSKNPGYKGWQRLRVTQDTLDKHFPQTKEQNIGILNGAPSNNALDVDLDCPEARMAAPHLLPPTEGGFGRKSAPSSHWIYRADKPLNSANEKYTDVNGNTLIELRGTGGQTVYPPSIHADTGERIEWVRFGDPGKVPLTELRDAVKEVAAVALLARHWPAQGTRQEAYMALVGGLIRAGCTRDGVEKLVSALAAATGDEEGQKRLLLIDATAAKLDDGTNVTGWPKLATVIGDGGDKIVKRVREWLGLLNRSAAGAETNNSNVRLQAAYKPFPLQALPQPIRDYVEQVSDALACDPAFVALPCLAAAASTIGNTRVIELKGGGNPWREPSILWTVVVAESGTLKSPAIKAGVEHLERRQGLQIMEFKEREEKYRDDLAAYERAKRAASKGGTDAGTPPKVPSMPRIVCKDVTIEKLAEILEDSPRGTLVARDELAAWIGSFSRYKGSSGGSDVATWLETSNAGTIMVERKTGDRRRIFVPRASVCITGGIQPSVLASSLSQNLRDSGFAARLLPAMPPRRPKRWRDVEVAPATAEAYHQCLDHLMLLDFKVIDGEKLPHVLRLSGEAKAKWIDFYNDWSEEQAAVDGELAAAFSKLEGYAARFALLHHVVGRVSRDGDDLVPVEKVSIEAGITLSQWFAGEARRIYATLSESEEQRKMRRLYELIQARGGQITCRNLMKANNRAYGTADIASMALMRLVDTKLARWVEVPTKMKGGKPIIAVELCQPAELDDIDDDLDELFDPEVDDTDLDEVVAVDLGEEVEPKIDEISIDGEAVALDDSLHDAPTPAGLRAASPAMANGDEASAASKNGATDGGRHHTADARMNTVQAGDLHLPSVMPEAWDIEETSQGQDAAVTSVPYFHVTDQEGLDGVVAALADVGIVGLDLETTGLNPRTDHVRLISLATGDGDDDEECCHVIDCFSVDPSPLWQTLAKKQLVIHNAAFDLAFLAQMGFVPGDVADTMVLAQVLTAGKYESVNLADCCDRWLDCELDKTEQTSDWSSALTEEQLGYAACDAIVLPKLLRFLQAKIKEAGLVETAKIEMDCLPSLIWMGRHGVALDKDRWETLANEASTEAARLIDELDKVAPPKTGEAQGRWNWNSPAQVKRALALAGCNVKNTTAETLAVTNHPIAQLLSRHRSASKLATTYGDDWLSHVAEDGRVYASWWQIGAASGRMSCSEPNLQQLPRGEHRSCIVAPPGRVLIKADYSQIELRIAAKISGDAALRDAYLRGEDLHKRTARSVLGVEEVTGQHRQLAKAINFGLVFGMSADGFRHYAKAHYGQDLSKEEACRYRDAFFAAYPSLAAWHRRVRSRGETETRTLTGRRRLLDHKTPDTQRLNTPIQGTGADGLKQALALLWQRRDQVPSAFPVMAVHDEIVIEADASQADTAAAWLKATMVDAMSPLIAPIPVEVTVNVGSTWGG